MERTPFSLLGTRRFLALFITQFLGAMNDNLFRQALIMLITYRIADQMSTQPAVLNNLAIGLFILPYFIFSALAGQLADKFDKSRQIVWIKLWEVGLMLLGALAFRLESLPLMIGVLSGLGLQSAFFGPIKYSILPELTSKDELLGANGLIEAGTFVSILLGLLIGGLLVLQPGGTDKMAYLMISLAVIGTISGSMVPRTGAAAPDLKLNFNVFTATGRQLKAAWQHDIARPAIICISWIWLYGSIYITQIPDIVKNRLGGDETVVTVIIACFSIGVGVGSLTCSRLLKGQISARLARPALLCLAATSVLLYLALPGENGVDATSVINLPTFLSIISNWFVLGLLIAVAIAAGMVIVPFYAILQDRSERSQRSRMIAANNIFNSGFMAGGTIIAAILITTGLTSSQILLLYAFANLLILPIATKLSDRLK
ncbi:MFS transporter [Kordiimonas aestuarii]|uniref:MFS transporter n=1 Tax=Kordiimonas aestuarii TaxID=1005925 RepID=UPI0021D131E3|nr:MFS transporter [Kordiimonas aestuarii]